MSFFKDLKARIFKLNTESKSSLMTSNAKISENVSKSKVDSLNQEMMIFHRNKNSKTTKKYLQGLEKSGNFFLKKIREIQSRHNQVNEEFFDALEELLIMSDISLNLVIKIVAAVKKEAKLANIQDPKLITEILAKKIFLAYTGQTKVNPKLNISKGVVNVVMITGVNGAGKTASVAKLAYLLKQENKKILIAAADTFRAGAIAQLVVLAQSIDVPVVKPSKPYADPSSVVYDALRLAARDNYDVLIIDTAGRMQNKVNLMNQLQKMNKIIVTSGIAAAPYETLLVVDSTTGQNGISQAQKFKEAVPITGIILTKMDGTAKGGIILTIKEQLDLTVKLIGLGEKIEDLQEFDLDNFIYGLTKKILDEKETH